MERERSDASADAIPGTAPADPTHDLGHDGSAVGLCEVVRDCQDQSAETGEQQEAQSFTEMCGVYGNLKPASHWPVSAMRYRRRGSVECLDVSKAKSSA